MSPPRSLATNHLLHGTLTTLLSGIPSRELFERPTLDAQLDRARSSAHEPVEVLDVEPAASLRRAGAGEGDIVAPLVLWSAAWDRAALAALADRLAAGPPARRLVFVEPVAALGWRLRAQRLTGRFWRRRLGYGFERDLPAELRASGFAIDTLDRFTLGPAGLRSYAYGTAIAATSPD